jgi:hypothetical protein
MNNISTGMIPTLGMERSILDLNEETKITNNVLINIIKEAKKGPAFTCINHSFFDEMLENERMFELKLSLADFLKGLVNEMVFKESAIDKLLRSTSVQGTEKYNLSIVRYVN